MKNIDWRPVWFDSMGAKSTCTMIKTKDISVLIDPGVAVMQPSFPASPEKKRQWKMLAKDSIMKASKEAQVIVVSHYHYDHYLPNELSLLSGKTLMIKDPNRFINDSQRDRALYFFDQICKNFVKEELRLLEPVKIRYDDPMDEIPIAADKMRDDLLSKGKKWFMNRVKRWNEYGLIPEMDLPSLKIRFPERNQFKLGDTKLRFTQPLFHGIEYSRLGWVFSSVISYDNEKFLHSSDLNGVYIEDYAEWIIKEDPDVLILDGPPTYMYGYMLSKENLERCVENVCRIIEEIDAEVIIYDHHLPRDPKYKLRVEKVYKKTFEEDIKITTAAEYLNENEKRS